jgi:hypothetical protein
VHNKACAFVTYNDPSAAQLAHSKMNKMNLHGQEIKVLILYVKIKII